MFVKGYKVSFPVKYIWSNGIKEKYFFDHDKAKAFFEEAQCEASKAGQYSAVVLLEVAFVLIENKHYCIGSAIEVE